MCKITKIISVALLLVCSSFIVGDGFCIDTSPLFIGDGKVDLEDFAEFGKYWMGE